MVLGGISTLDLMVASPRVKRSKETNINPQTSLITDHRFKLSKRLFKGI